LAKISSGSWMVVCSRLPLVSSIVALLPVMITDFTRPA